MTVLRGVVYMTKSSGPRTEPWGTPQEDVYQEDRSVSPLTQKQRDDRYEHTCVLYRSTALFLDNGSKNLQCLARMALNVGANVTVYPHI